MTLNPRPQNFRHVIVTTSNVLEQATFLDLILDIEDAKLFRLD